MPDERFDVVIIGAGPAGSRTAAVAATNGFSVLLLEKRERIGYPVRCAEAVGPRIDVERFLELEDRLISSPVNGAIVFAPDGTKFKAKMPGVGFVIDRELFDQSLADIAGKNGAVVRTSSQVMGLIEEDGRIAGVKVKDLENDTDYTVGARIVVGADGIEAISPRWAGLRRAFGLDEIFSCAEFTVEGIELESDGPFIEFHLGRRFAPGGYAWVFPKGPSSANVGVGVKPSMTNGKKAIDFLGDFLEHRCPGARVKRTIVGGCGAARELQSLATDGFLVVGEAANHNNPFSGGGIINALEAADIAGGVICEALGKNDTSAGRLSVYTKKWKKSVGRNNTLFYHAAEIFYRLEDAEMDRMIRRLTSTPGIIGEKGVKPLKMLLVLGAGNPKIMFKVIGALIKKR